MGRRVVATEWVDSSQLPGGLPAVAAGALRHERIPFVSYPFEWPFSMLRDAALLQLDLNRRALRDDLTLKDASAYNVQFRGSEPVFIDIGSFRSASAPTSRGPATGSSACCSCSR